MARGWRSSAPLDEPEGEGDHSFSPHAKVEKQTLCPNRQVTLSG